MANENRYQNKTATEVAIRQAAAAQLLAKMQGRTEQQMRWLRINLDIYVKAAIAQDEIREMADAARAEIYGTSEAF